MCLIVRHSSGILLRLQVTEFHKVDGVGQSKRNWSGSAAFVANVKIKSSTGRQRFCKLEPPTNAARVRTSEWEANRNPIFVTVRRNHVRCVRFVQSSKVHKQGVAVLSRQAANAKDNFCRNRQQ